MKPFPVAALLLTLAWPAAWMLEARAQERVVNVYNWTDYIEPKTLQDFTKETGIKVVYDVYDKNETLEDKLLAGQSGYDVVVPSGPSLQRLVQAKLVHKIDRGKLSHAGNIWSEIDRRLAVYDPGNLHAVTYMWGTTGIGLNLRKVRERLGANAQLNSWELFLKPELIGKLKDCGVHVLDAPEDIFPGVLSALGLKPDSKSPSDIEKAAGAVFRVRGQVRKFHASDDITALASGDICMAVGHSGAMLQAKKRAQEAKNGVEIAYVIPKEGALMWLDSFAIPTDAKNVAEAHAFIDYMLRADVAARNTNYVSHASGNLAAKPLVAPGILGNPGIYPDDETFKHLFSNSAYDDKIQRVVTRQWTRVLTGK